MINRIIKAGDADYVIKAAVPDEVRGATEYTITITDKAGNLLVDEDDATVGVADELAADAVAGATSMTLAYTGTPYTPAAGDVLLLGDDVTGYQSLTVRAFDASTGVITTQEFVDYPYPSGTPVEWRDVTYSVDASAAEWADLTEVTVTWSPDNDCLPWTELYQVLARSAAVGGLESEFRIAYPRYHEQIASGTFSNYLERAKARLRLYLESRGRDFDRGIDSPRLADPLMLTIALLVAEANSDRFADEYERLKTAWNEQLALMDKLPLWVDLNQDRVENDEETAPATQPGLSRGL